MGNAVVHFEIMGEDDEKLGKFYSQAFGWQVHPAMPGYSMVHGETGGIGGGIGKEDKAAIRFYVDVDDVQGTLDKLEKLGAKTVLPPTQSGPVTMALFQDPEGNVIGLAKSNS